MKFLSNKIFQIVFKNTKIIERAHQKSKKNHIEILILKEFLQWETSEQMEDLDQKLQETFIQMIKSKKRLLFRLLNKRRHWDLDQV